MKGWKMLWALKFVALMLVALFVLGYVVMYLWNWLIPDIFGLETINFYQALGLLLLSKILLWGFRPGWGGKGGHWKHKQQWREQWSKMSPEEREKFKSKCFGHYYGCKEPHPEADASTTNTASDQTSS